MGPTYNSPNSDYSTARAEYAAFANSDYTPDVVAQAQSPSMMYTNSSGSNHGGWDHASPGHDAYSLATQMLDGSSQSHYDPTQHLSPAVSYDSGSYSAGFINSAPQQSPQQIQRLNFAASPQQQQQSQEALMAQMMTFASAYEFANAAAAPIASSSTAPISGSQPAFVSPLEMPRRMQRTSSLSSVPIEYNAIPIRPSNGARRKSHSVAETFGMMGPPPRPLGRTPHPSALSPLARSSQPAGPTSPQNSPASPTASQDSSYQPYRSSPFAPPAPAPAQVLASTPLSPQQASKAAFPVPSPSSFSMNPTRPSSPFDAASRGLPTLHAPPAVNSTSSPWSGMYSSSGFDMVGVLARVASRPNPQLALGPVDLGCSFLVVDARKFDQPIIFVSETFTRLTGYSSEEILGRNCRFMQAPDGQVVQGEKRKYTDGNAAYHIRRHIMQGKESQASMINYCKGGRPFINLITVIPITWDSDEIAYYVGFQVDMVDQPSAIMEKMKNGSYVIDYRRVNSNLPREISAPSIESISVEHLDELTGASGQAQANAASHSFAPEASMDVDLPGSVLDQVDGRGPGGLANEAGRKLFNRMLLENCDDFVHVLSLKGSLLYVSPSSKRLLEYEPQGLVGKSLSSFCHPSDIVSVLRELKESGSSPHDSVDLVFRFRRKHSGYTWIEAHGKLHLEQGKGRKCVILVGRVRQVYKMSWSDLERAGGFGKDEYWSKLSTNGMHLYSTPNVSGLLGFSAQDMVGKTFTELSPQRDASEVMKALERAAQGLPSTVRHQLVNKTGVAVEVVTHFYPSRSQTDEEPTSPLSEAAADPFTVIAQTNSAASELSKDPHPVLPSAPSAASRALAAQKSNSSSSASSGKRPSLCSASSSMNSSAASSSSSSRLTLPSFNMSARGSADSESTSGTSAGHSTTSFSAITSTYMTLQMNRNVSDNIFDELDSVRGTSWQFELHQMRLTNKKLREEKGALVALQNKKRRREAGQCSDQGKPAQPGVRACLNCGKTQSAEWRTGPTGPKTLCNACGLRWSKSRSNSNVTAKTSAMAKSPKSIGASPSAAVSPSRASPSPANLAYPTPAHSSEEPSLSPVEGDASGGASTPVNAVKAMSIIGGDGSSEFDFTTAGLRGAGGAGSFGGPGPQRPAHHSARSADPTD